jgi:probable HAF family extracellular repeat protein
MISSPLRRTGVIAALALLPVFAASAETLTAKRINNAITLSLSADGAVAVGMLPGTYETFRWTAKDGVVGLGRATLPALGVRSGNAAVSANGKIVAATIVSDDGTTATAGKWTASSGWQMLKSLGPVPDEMAPIDNTDSSAYAISGDGKVIAGLYWRGESWQAHAMRWTSGNGMTDAGSSGYNSRINAVNANGTVMVGWDEHPDFRNWRAAVWVKGKLTVLEDSDWFTEATAVNSDGTIVVGQTPDPDNAMQMTATMWKWNGSSWDKSYLGVMPKKPGKAASSVPLAVSDDGSVVVGENHPDASKPVTVGFIWTPATGMVNATDWLKANAVRVGPLYPVTSLSTMTPDGKVIAAIETQKVAPFGQRTLLIQRAP